MPVLFDALEFRLARHKRRDGQPFNMVDNSARGALWAGIVLFCSFGIFMTSRVGPQHFKPNPTADDIVALLAAGALAFTVVRWSASGLLRTAARQLGVPYHPVAGVVTDGGGVRKMILTDGTTMRVPPRPRPWPADGLNDNATVVAVLEKEWRGQDVVVLDSGEWYIFGP